MMNESNKTQIFFKLKLLLNYWKLYACVYNEDTAEGQRSCFLRSAKLFNRQLDGTCTDTFLLRSGEPPKKSSLVWGWWFHYSAALPPHGTLNFIQQSLGPAHMSTQVGFGCSRLGGWNSNISSDVIDILCEGPNFPNTKLYSVALIQSRRNTANLEPDAASLVHSELHLISLVVPLRRQANHWEIKVPLNTNMSGKTYSFPFWKLFPILHAANYIGLLLSSPLIHFLIFA